MPTLIDRSRIETTWLCPRKRYWNYEYGGRGIVKIAASHDLMFGSTLHTMAASLALGTPVAQVAAWVQGGLQEWYTANEYSNDAAQQWISLALGHTWIYADYTLPSLLEHGEIITVEHDVAVPFGGDFSLMIKPDLIIRQHDTTKYVELKTTGWNNAGWVNQWAYAVQLHAGMWAVEQACPDWGPVRVCDVIGMYKGYKKDGMQQSPLVWGYRAKPQAGLPEQWTARYTRAFDKRPLSEYPGSMRDWVHHVLDDETRAAQVIRVPPIMRNDRLIESFLKQTLRQEAVIRAFGDLNLDAEAKATLIDDYFPQYFSSCSKFGRPCQYEELCFHPHMATDPLRTGDFMWREPHHEMETFDSDDAG